MKKFFAIIRESITLVSGILTIVSVIIISGKPLIFNFDFNQLTVVQKQITLSVLLWYGWIAISWFISRRYFLNLIKLYNVNHNSEKNIIIEFHDRYYKSVDNIVFFLGALLSIVSCHLTQYWIGALFFGLLVNVRIIAVLQPLLYEDMTFMKIE